MLALALLWAMSAVAGEITVTAKAVSTNPNVHVLDSMGNAWWSYITVDTTIYADYDSTDDTVCVDFGAQCTSYVYTEIITVNRTHGVEPVCSTFYNVDYPFGDDKCGEKPTPDSFVIGGVVRQKEDGLPSGTYWFLWSKGNDPMGWKQEDSCLVEWDSVGTNAALVCDTSSAWVATDLTSGSVAYWCGMINYIANDSIHIADVDTTVGHNISHWEIGFCPAP